MEEIFKDIVGFEGYYEVSNLGRIKSLWFGKERILKPAKNSNGYLFVNLCKDKEKHKKLVHRLVTQAFIPNPENKKEVDHINTIKDDNRVYNLRWASKSENQNNPLTLKHYSNAKKGEKNPLYKKFGKDNPLSKPIIQLTKNGRFVKRYDSITDCVRETGFNGGNISCCCKGKYKSVKGYKFMYKEDYEKDYEKIPFKVFKLEIYIKKVV